MATQRYISTSFWDDPWVQTIGPMERYLYLYLLTCPLTNIAGVYEITTRRISFDTHLKESQISEMLTMFTKCRKAVWYRSYIILPAWPSHQKWNTSPKIKKGIDIILESLPHEIIKCMVYIEYRYPMDTLFIPPTYPSNYLDSDLDLDLDTEADSDGLSARPIPVKTLKQPKPMPENFLKFWTVYPKKRHRLEALKAWFQMENSMPDIDIVINKLMALSKTFAWTKEKGEYIPNPATWLRAGGWDDEVEIAHEPAKIQTHTAQIHKADGSVSFIEFTSEADAIRELTVKGYSFTGAEWRPSHTWTEA